MKRLFVLLLVALALASAGCRKRTVISDRELAQIFRDAFLTNAYLNDRNVRTDSVNLYEPIFARYGYTTEDVQYTVGNFSRRKSARLSDVVEEAIALLEAEGKRYDHEVAVLDTVRKTALRETRRTLRRDSVVRVRSLRDTALLSMRFEVAPGEYVVSYAYEVDSLDRNARLQSRFWLDRRDGRRTAQQTVALRRNYREEIRRTFRVDSVHSALELHLLAFPETARQPSVTFYDLQVTHTLPEEEALAELFRRQLDTRIFADEFLHGDPRE